MAYIKKYWKFAVCGLVMLAALGLMAFSGSYNRRQHAQWRQRVRVARKLSKTSPTVRTVSTVKRGAKK